MTARRAAAIGAAALLMSCALMGCSSPSKSYADPLSGLTCSSDRFGGVTVDHSGTSGDSSPLVAVALYVASVGSALPKEGYAIDNSFGADRTTQVTPSSEIYPGETAPPSTVPRSTQTIVHRSKHGVDVVVTVVDYGGGWQVASANYCPEALH